MAITTLTGEDNQNLRMRAIMLSVAVSLVLLTVKMAAYYLLETFWNRQRITRASSRIEPDGKKII